MLNPRNLKPGEEQHEEFHSSILKKTLVQYDYRHTNGELFSTAKVSLEACQKARDQWLEKQ